MIINMKCRNLFHRINLSIFIAMLFTASFYQAYWFYIVWSLVY
ncbi:GSCOCG00001594001-RA-CDS [Cotesia congregata]|nr:GSCOCG00001594001-RA-CDS [Cotesia congregata]